jgi:hypothetical protein
MRVFVQQPQLFPWVGFWHKVMSADAYVMYSGVQYRRSEYQNRVLVNGEWLTLPVQGTLGTAIDELELDPRSVRKLGIRLRQTCMSRKWPFSHRLHSLVDLMGTWDNPSFLDFHIASYRCLSLSLGVKTPMVVDTIHREGPAIMKLNDCLGVLGYSGCQLLAGENCRHFGYESMPLVQSVAYQRLLPGLDPNSILPRLTREAHPDEYVSQAGTWESR